MLRYENKGFILQINLKDNFKVNVVYTLQESNKETGINKYCLNLYLLSGTEHSEDDLCMRIDSYVLESTVKDVKVIIARDITEKFENGYFNSFIEEFNRIYDYIDYGYENIDEKNN